MIVPVVWSGFVEPWITRRLSEPLSSVVQGVGSVLVGLSVLGGLAMLGGIVTLAARSRSATRGRCRIRGNA